MQSMKCPACDREFSLLSGLKSTTPYFIKCGGCRTVTRIRMPGLNWLVALGLLVVLAGAGASYYALRFHGDIPGVVAVCSTLFAFFLLEIFAFWMFDRYATLVISRPGPNVRLDPAPEPEATPPRPPESPPPGPGDRAPTSRD